MPALLELLTSATVVQKQPQTFHPWQMWLYTNKILFTKKKKKNLFYNDQSEKFKCLVKLSF